jgi:PIN domain nuclease of toxin-antitoxin system
MRDLLDTHIFLWYVTTDPKLPEDVRDRIRQPGRQIYVSVASEWELVIKHALGKIDLPEPPHTLLPRLRAAHAFGSLPVEEDAVPHLAGLQSIHRDPFDRILVAQTLQYGLTLVSVDTDVRKYPVPVYPPRPI